MLLPTCKYRLTIWRPAVPSSCCPLGSLLPVTVFDGHSLRVLFHFARDSPPSRPDVLVVIISMLSSAPVPVTDINFQTTAPKVSSSRVRGLCLPFTEITIDKICTYKQGSLFKDMLTVLLLWHVCFHLWTLVYGSEAAAPIGVWAPSFQPHPSSCCCHSDPAAGKPKQSKLRCFMT